MSFYYSLSLSLPPSLPPSLPLSLLAGNVESTEPTKCLMRIAEYVDSSEHNGGALREWFLDNREEVLDMLAEEEGRVERIKRETVAPERCVCMCTEVSLKLKFIARPNEQGSGTSIVLL